MKKFCAYCGSKVAATEHRYIVIGDVHGMLRELGKLWTQVRPSKADKVIFIGDLIDKGPHSNEVVTFVREKEEDGYDIILIKGNHEDKHLENWAKGKDTEVEVTEDNIEFLRSAIPHYKFRSGGKLFSCVHGGFYPAHNKPLMDNAELKKVWREYLELKTEWDIAKGKVQQLKDENKRLSQLKKFERTPEDKEKMKTIQAEIKAAEQVRNEKKQALKEISSVVKSLKGFFITRYVDEMGNNIPTVKNEKGEWVPEREGTYWADLYEGQHGTTFYGHESFPEVNEGKHSYGLDTGAVYGGKLTAAIVQNGDIQFSSANAEKAYANHEKFE